MVSKSRSFNCIQSKNVVTISLCRFYTKHDYDQEKYLVLQGNSEIFEFIRGGYAPISKEEATLA